VLGRYTRSLAIVLFFSMPVLALTIVVDRTAHDWAMASLPTTDVLATSSAHGLVLARIVHPAPDWAITALPIILATAALVIDGVVLPMVVAGAPGTGAWLSLAFGLVLGGGTANALSLLGEHGVTDFIDVCAPGRGSMCIAATPADLAAALGLAMVALAASAELVWSAAMWLRRPQRVVA
jgi:lipoprotein signal peptidase